MFLDLLEPYILKEKITYLAPEVMAAFVDNFQHRGDLGAVERCLLHMDVKVLDFNTIVTICRKHRLYSALCHVYTRGLDDFTTPLELLLEGAITAADDQLEAAPSVATSPTSLSFGMGLDDGSVEHSAALEGVGYKALLYLHYSLQGRVCV